MTIKYRCHLTTNTTCDIVHKSYKSAIKHADKLSKPNIFLGSDNWWWVRKVIC